jgi:hypothetical protein
MKVSFYALTVGAILLAGSALCVAQTVEELVDSLPAFKQEALELEQEKDRLDQENASFAAEDLALQSTYQAMMPDDASLQQRAADLAEQRQTLDQEISEYNNQCEDAVFDIPENGGNPAYERCLTWESALSERNRRLETEIDRYNPEMDRHQTDQASFSDRVVAHDAKKEELQQAGAAFTKRLAAWWEAFDYINRSGALKRVGAEVLAEAGCSPAEMAGFLAQNRTGELPVPTEQVRQCLEIIWANVF